MMMKYLTLPSNVCTEMYRNNVPSHFIVNLPAPISFSGDWEVGLSEVHLPCSWNNVTNGCFRIIEDKIESSYGDLEIKLRTDTMFSFNAFVLHMSRKIPKELKNKIRIETKTTEGVLCVYVICEKGYSLQFGELAEYFGIDKRDRWFEGRNEFIVPSKSAFLLSLPTVFGLKDGHNTFAVRFPKDISSEVVTIIEIRKGRYKSIRSIIDSINDELTKKS